MNDPEIDMDTETRRLYNKLISQGYEDEHARAIGRAHTTLKQGSFRLSQLRGPPKNNDRSVIIEVRAFGSDQPDVLLLHDNVLMPEWKRFADALSSVPASEKGYIHINLIQVLLGKATTDMLLQSFKTAPICSMSMRNNGLGNDGMKIAVGAIQSISTLEYLHIQNNPIESANDATTLVQVLNTHARFSALMLEKCGIGTTDAVMAAIVPALNCVREVDLRDNFIGSHGAKLIADILESNPCVESLTLYENLFTDDDLVKLAKPLKTNTNLRGLGLAGNDFTDVGIKVMYGAVLNHTSLNGIHDSNHTCCIETDDDRLQLLNSRDDPTVNRKAKIMSVLVKKYAKYLNDAPIEIMPKVLEFIQCRWMDASRYNCLNVAFLFIREWNTSLVNSKNNDGQKEKRTITAKRRKI